MSPARAAPPLRGSASTAPAETRTCEAIIAAATPLQLMIAETMCRFGRQGWDTEAIVPKIDEWFPEASAGDKSQALEVACAYALLSRRYGSAHRRQKGQLS